MSAEYRTTWETYVASWKALSTDEKRALFERCLAPRCIYTDPLTRAENWDELLRYMLDFHRQVPGGHFVTTQFVAHHDRCMASWSMRNGEGTSIGEGVSFGQYDDTGRLTNMTGFFATPES